MRVLEEYCDHCKKKLSQLKMANYLYIRMIPDYKYDIDVALCDKCFKKVKTIVKALKRRI